MYCSSKTSNTWPCLYVRVLHSSYCYHRALVDAKVVGGNPPARRAVRHFVCLVERWLEAIALRHAEVEPSHGADGGDDDLRSERERGDHHPRRQGAVVGTVGRSARVVVVELPLDAVHRPLLPAGAVGRRDSPAEFAVAGKLQRVAHRVLLVDVRRLAAVLEVVAAVLPHERVAEVAEVDPEMRELVREQRPGVEHLAAVDLLPLVGRAVSGVALGRQREGRRAEAEQVQQQPLVVAGPAVRDEAGLRSPAVGDRRAAVQRPLPVGPAVELVGQAADLGLLLGVRVEVGGAGEHPGEQEGRVDRGELALPDPASALHVQEVVVEALVAGGIGLRAVRAVAEEAQPFAARSRGRTRGRSRRVRRAPGSSPERGPRRRCWRGRMGRSCRGSGRWPGWLRAGSTGASLACSRFRSSIGRRLVQFLLVIQSVHIVSQEPVPQRATDAGSPGYRSRHHPKWLRGLRGVARRSPS